MLIEITQVSMSTPELQLEQLLRLKEQLEHRLWLEDHVSQSADDAYASYRGRDKYVRAYLRRKALCALRDYMGIKAQLDDCIRQIAELSA